MVRDRRHSSLWEAASSILSCSCCLTTFPCPPFVLSFFFFLQVEVGGRGHEIDYVFSHSILGTIQARQRILDVRNVQYNATAPGVYTVCMVSSLRSGAPHRMVHFDWHRSDRAFEGSFFTQYKNLAEMNHGMTLIERVLKNIHTKLKASDLHAAVSFVFCKTMQVLTRSLPWVIFTNIHPGGQHFWQCYFRFWRDGSFVVRRSRSAIPCDQKVT